MSFNPGKAPDRNNWFGWLRETVVGSPTEKWVLAAICMRTDDSLSAFPRRCLLKADTELGQSTITRAVKKLREKGLLFAVPLVDDDGQTANLYVPNIDGWLDDAEDLEEVYERVVAVGRRKQAKQLLPYRSRVNFQLAEENPQVDEAAPSEQAGMLAGSRPGCSQGAGRDARNDQPRKNNIPEEQRGNTHTPSAPDHETDTPSDEEACVSEDSQENPGEEDVEAAKALLRRVTAECPAAKHVSQAQADALVAEVCVLMSSGWSVVTIEAGLSGAVDANTIAPSQRLHARLEALAARNPGETAFGAQEASERTSEGRRRGFCGMCGVNLPDDRCYIDPDTQVGGPCPHCGRGRS